MVARSTPAPSAYPARTPEDDTGDFVDPTPTAPGAVAAGLHGPTGPHITLPILLYHYIRVNPVPSDKVGWNLSVTPTNFAQQMAFLRFIGAHTLTLGDALDALRTGKALPPRSVILTFDDGYFDFASKAAPVMFQDGLKGTVFVVSGFLGRNGYMTRPQVRQVAAMGMVIGCHTVSHVALAGVPLSFAQQQIDIAHQQLQQLTGTPVTDFAYPYGSYDAAVEQLVKANGFADAVTTDAGAELYLSQPDAWPRYRVGGSDTLLSFAHKALFGMPLAGINHLVGAFLVSPQANPTPTPRAATAQVDADSRRYA